MRNKAVIVASLLMLTAVLGYVNPFSQYDVDATSGSQYNEQVIKVEGVSEISVKPDLAKVNLAVETRNESADLASEENAKLTESLISALNKFGLKEDQIETNNYRLYTVRDSVNSRIDETEHTINYQVVNEINVSTDDLENVGELIDTAINSGANQIRGVYFEIKDSESVKLEALQEATYQAERKAEAIAEAAGVSIKTLVTIEEQGGSYSPSRADYMTKEIAVSNSSTPIEPGDVKVSARVVAKYKF